MSLPARPLLRDSRGLQDRSGSCLGTLPRSAAAIGSFCITEYMAVPVNLSLRLCGLQTMHPSRKAQIHSLRLRSQQHYMQEITQLLSVLCGSSLQQDGWSCNGLTYRASTDVRLLDHWICFLTEIHVISATSSTSSVFALESSARLPWSVMPSLRSFRFTTRATRCHATPCRADSRRAKPHIRNASRG